MSFVSSEPGQLPLGVLAGLALRESNGLSQADFASEIGNGLDVAEGLKRLEIGTKTRTDPLHLFDEARRKHFRHALVDEFIELLAGGFNPIWSTSKPCRGSRPSVKCCEIGTEVRKYTSNARIIFGLSFGEMFLAEPGSTRDSRRCR